MRQALWVLLAALPLAGQPKLLVNAKTDTRSAASGLEREFRALLTTQPQPAWLGYEVPAVRNAGLGCDYVRDGYNGGVAGTVHLEPPTTAVILFRVEGSVAQRIRTSMAWIRSGSYPVRGDQQGFDGRGSELRDYSFELRASRRSAFVSQLAAPGSRLEALSPGESLLITFLE